MIITLALTTGTLAGLRPMLTEAGWQVLERPLLRQVEPADWGGVDAALSRLDRYGAVAFTSPRGAAAFAGRLALLGTPTESIPDCWALGPQTAAALPAGLRVRTPARFAGGSELAEAMLLAGVRGPVLHCCGREHRPELGDRLRGAGVLVEDAVCYEIEMAAPHDVAEALGGTDLVVIGSHRLIRMAASVSVGSRPDLICLGPATAATARAAGWEPAAVAATPTAPGVAAAIRSIASAIRATDVAGGKFSA